MNRRKVHKEHTALVLNSDIDLLLADTVTQSPTNMKTMNSSQRNLHHSDSKQRMKQSA